MLYLLLFASPTTALRPATTINPCILYAASPSHLKQFAEEVWVPNRWRRGDPPAKTIKAWRLKLHCLPPGWQKKLKQRWRELQGIYFHKRHHCRGGIVIRGRVSYFGGGLMASGHYTSEPAIALNIAPGTEAGWDNATTRAWVASGQRFRVTIAGHSAVLFAGDLGPAGFTGRAIDVTDGGVAALGLGGVFPTDAIGTAKLIPGGCS